MRRVNLSGHRFGRLTVIQPAASRGRRTQWLVRCDCGTQKSVGTEALRAGQTFSCGCLAREAIRRRSLTHGDSAGYQRTKEYRAWCHAKGRCFNPNDGKYPCYGGRGIRMCEEWSASFESFLQYMGRCPKGASLDRIDVNGNYEPGNCRWASKEVQHRNRTDNVFVDYEGQAIVLKDFARLSDVPYKKLHSYVKYRGMSPKEAVSAIRSRSSHHP